MSRDIDDYVEDYTAWLHDMYSAPGSIECDNCGQWAEEDVHHALEFRGGFFCCDECFEEALLTNEVMREEWIQQELYVDDF